MVWKRKVLLATMFALCLSSEGVLASKNTWARLKQLPLINKLVEAQGGTLAQQAATIVLAFGIACTGIGCGADEDEGDKLTEEEKRHIQYVNGLLPVQERDYSTYVHIESKYRNTRQRSVHEGDVVYFLQDGGVFGGIVERHVPPERVIVAQLYGTGIYNDSHQQKRLIELDLIKGVSFQYHEDAGLILVMDNDDSIFRRDDDDYIARFYARVVNVYDDGFYRVLVEYGTDPQGNRVYLQNSYTLFTHRDIWTTDSKPIIDHPDIGVEAIVLGPTGTNIEYLLGEVTRVYDDGFYEIEVSAELDFDQNRIELDEIYSVYMHESTPLRDGGFLLRRADGF